MQRADQTHRAPGETWEAHVDTSRRGEGGTLASGIGAWWRKCRAINIHHLGRDPCLNDASVLRKGAVVYSKDVPHEWPGCGDDLVEDDVRRGLIQLYKDRARVRVHEL